MSDIPIHKIEPLNLGVVLLRLFFLGVIFLCIINFKINNVLFSVFICISVLIILFSATSRLCVYDNRFEIIHKRLIPFSSKIIYKYEDISSLEYSRSFFNPLNLIYALPGTDKQKEFIIKYKEKNKEENVRIIGTKKQAVEAINIINKEIQKFNRHHGIFKI